MAKGKSLTKKLVINTAKKKHKCKSNSKHIILKGDIRLEVHEGRNNHTYCKDCGIKFTQTGLEELARVLQDLKTETLS